MSASEMERRVAAVRRFNRFYTRQIGVLEEVLLDTPFSLTEARVLYELAHHDATTATALGESLGLDAGYLSRILRGFQQGGLLDRRPSEADGRQSLLSLTEAGREAFARLDEATRGQIGALLGALPVDAQERLVGAMETVEGLLRGIPECREPYVLRAPRPGDMGWVVRAHGLLYWREQGWNEEFEALVADIVATFVRELDPARERCWIAERDGENVGSIFLVRASDEVAKLRLLLVDPSARGLGLGRRLVDECIAFARAVGYRRMTLWTNDVLHAARHIYQRVGFQLVREEPHHAFGHDLVSQTWELEL